MTKMITKIWMLIALLLVATTGYAQKTIIQKSNADYSLTSKLSFSGSSFVDTQGADKDGYNEASYRVFEGVLSPNEPLKIQCSASCLNGKKKAKYEIRISIWFTKENGSEVKSPVNGGGVKTSQDQPLSVSCKIPKEATYAKATIEVNGALGTGVDPSTICHLSYKIQGRDGSQSKNSGNTAKTSTSKRPSWWKEREPEPISRCDHPLSGISINDLCGEVSVRCNDDEDDSYEFAELDGLIREEDRIRTKEESEVILGLEDMNTYHIRPNSIVVIRTEKNKVTKFEMIVGSIWANIKKMAEGKSIELEMSHCVSGIKGTIVAFEERNGKSNVYLFAGSVEVTSKKGKKKVMLKAGQASSVGKDGQVKVQKFDIEKGAKKFGIPMKDIKNHYSNKPSASSSATQKRYGMERGVITYSFAKGNQKGTVVRTFDKYGQLERQASKVSGSSTTNVTIYRGSKGYQLDEKTKKVKQGKYTPINFLNISDADLKKHKLTKKGTATVAGKQCTVYQSSTTTYYVWNGITLKKIVNSKNGKSVSEATKIEQPASIDENKFKVPQGYSVK